MPAIPHLHEFVLIFIAALVVIAISYRLRVPPIVGFLITGMVVGPTGLGWIGESEHVKVFAELGVVFILFGIGLEISVDRMRRLARVLLLGGAGQMALTTAAVWGAGRLLGYSPRVALYFGLVVALSSTAIVFKRYSERRELESPHGQVATGILLFQDFLIVPLLLVVPFLAGTIELSGGGILARFGAGMVAVAVVFAASRMLMPIFLRFLASTKVRELFVLGALVICLGGAWVTESLGFSLALGAFLAGVLVSESDYHHQVLAETGPFRDVFNSLFFISVGMVLSLDFALKNLGMVLLAVAVVIGLKAAVLYLTVGFLGFPHRTRIVAALGLAQMGEFSFVLVAEGQAHGLLDEWHYNTAVAVAVITMLLTPLLMAMGARLALGRTTEAGPGSVAEPADLHGPGPGHVVVAGYGLNGRHLARVLEAAGLPFVVVEANVWSVREGTAAGRRMLYGDITRQDIQEAAGMGTARAAVFAISDPLALRHAVRLARQMSPGLFIVARTRHFADLERLRQCGADEVVAEEFESSIEIVTVVLRRLHVPGNIIRTQARLLRADGYEMLRTPRLSGLSESMVKALTAGATETFLLDVAHRAVGQTLSQLDLRQRTGATVLAVVRGDRPQTNPSADLQLLAGDLLILVGSHGEIEDAFRQLQENREAPPPR